MWPLHTNIKIGPGACASLPLIIDLAPGDGVPRASLSPGEGTICCQGPVKVAGVELWPSPDDSFVTPPRVYRQVG